MSQPIVWTPQFDDFDKLIRLAPRSVYRRMRDYVADSFFDHRKNWLRAKGLKFGRSGIRKDGTQGKGIKVYRVGEKGPTTDRTVHYDVPTEFRAQSEADAADKLLKLGKAEIRTGSLVLPVHEDGAKIQGDGLMSIPVRTRARSIGEFKRKNPTAKVRWLAQGRKGALVFEEKGKRIKRWKLRFVLRRSVQNKPTLKFYSTWERLKSKRSLAFSDAASRLVSDIAKGRK